MQLFSLPAPRIRNGAYYYELLSTPTTSGRTTATVNDKEKLLFDNSTFSVQLVTNSYKYGSELQFVAWSREAPHLEKRVDKEHFYYRLEVGYLPATHETAEKLRQVADMLDDVIGYESVSVSVGSKKVWNGELAELVL